MGESRQRIDRVLAHLGLGTRKEVKALVRTGRVSVNGEVVRDAGAHVDPVRDHIEVDGVSIHYRRHIYLMMNKPAGVLTATRDAKHTVVTDLLEPEHQQFEPFPVGRLDKDTEGLLLLTNDGALAHRLLLPRYHVPKVYCARVTGQVPSHLTDAFRRGVRLNDGYVTLPATLRILRAEPETSEVEVTLVEGKYHQVKRMFAAFGHTVLYLRRIAMGPLLLDPDLEPGTYRELTEAELEQLRSALQPGADSETEDAPSVGESAGEVKSSNFADMPE
jgi:16S rRNA pseudouridine516 synthase